MINKLYLHKLIFKGSTQHESVTLRLLQQQLFSSHRGRFDRHFIMYQYVPRPAQSLSKVLLHLLFAPLPKLLCAATSTLITCFRRIRQIFPQYRLSTKRNNPFILLQGCHFWRKAGKEFRVCAVNGGVGDPADNQSLERGEMALQVRREISRIQGLLVLAFWLFMYAPLALQQQRKNQGQLGRIRTTLTSPLSLYRR